MVSKFMLRDTDGKVLAYMYVQELPDEKVIRIFAEHGRKQPTFDKPVHTVYGAPDIKASDIADALNVSISRAEEILKASAAYLQR